jgi:putative component of membrane protein insertase Oxa1/YidC/SpoIIIJ protein YidD
MDIRDGVRRVFGGAAQFGVSTYQNYISSDYNRENDAKCVFTPSCSAYMRESVDLLGVKQGVLDGFDRLSRCVPAELEKVQQRFYRQLHQTPETELASKFGVDPKDHDLLGHLCQLKAHMAEIGKMCSDPKARTFAEHLANMPAEQRPKAQELHEKASDIIKNKIDIMAEDLPGRDPSMQDKIFIRRHYVIPEGVQATGLAKVCSTAARWVAAGLGGVAASIPLMLAGGALGALKGAGGGFRPSANFAVPPAAVERLLRTQASLQESIQNQTLQRIVGVPVGMVLGGLLGAQEGIKKAFQVAGKMTGILAKNLTLELFGLHPAGCGCGCNDLAAQQARMHPSKLNPEVVQAATPMAQKKWTVVSHLDATDIQLEPAITGHVIDMERSAGPKADANFVVELRRSGLSPEEARINAWRMRTFLPVAAMLGPLISIPISGLAPLSALKSGLLVGGNLYWLANRGKIRADQAELAHEERSWKGTRIYEISPHGVDKPEHLSIQTPIASATGRSEGAPAQELGAGWLKHFQKYPSTFQAVVLGGHGVGYKRVCGMDYREAAEACQVASQGLGKKLDVVVLEACQSATLEGLNNLAPHARYAIASQENVGVAGFPWAHLVEHFSDPDKEAPGQTIDRDAETLSSKWVRRYGAGGNPNFPTLTLIDLQKLPALVESLEGLAGHLQDKPEQTQLLFSQSEQVRHFPHLGPIELDGQLGKLEKLWKQLKRKTIEKPSLGDLQSLVAGLKERTQDAQVQKLCDQVLQAFDDSIVVNRSEKGGAAGLSVQLPQWKLFGGEYQRRSGLKEWGTLINAQRSWPHRLWTSALDSLHQGVTAVFPSLKRFGLLDKV